MKDYDEAEPVLVHDATDALARYKLEEVGNEFTKTS